MGADPIAMCGNCREIKAKFPITACVSCINERFSTDINEKSGRVVTKGNLNQPQEWSPHCCRDASCDELNQLIACMKADHRVLIDPDW